jgi:AraC-like DNA-binding protein
MNYFDDLSLIWGDEYPRCRSRIDQQFKDCCSLQLSLGGPLSFGIEHKTPMQTDGPLFFWHHPSLNYQYCSIGKGNWHHLWVSFRGPRAMRLIERGFMSLQPEGFVIPRKVEWAAQTMRDLIGLSRSSGKSRASAALLIEELLVWVEEETELETLQQPQSIQKIQMIVRSIQTRAKRGFNFHRAAAEAGLSYSHFRALFFRTMGVSPSAYMLRRVMEQAGAELLRTHLTIGQIGERAGYPDPAQFSKAFKKSTGLSPKAFRQGAANARKADSLP